jgi:hypothetical protein
MTLGERMVWAAAYVAAMNASHGPADAERVAWLKVMILRADHGMADPETIPFDQDVSANDARDMAREAMGYGGADVQPPCPKCGGPLRLPVHRHPALFDACVRAWRDGEKTTD